MKSLFAICRHFSGGAAAALLLIHALPTSGFTADYGAELKLDSIYTTNLTLAPSGQEQTQWLNAIVPRLYLTQTGGNYEVDIDYELQALFYAGESELNEAFSRLWATGLLDLVGEELVLRAFARATQINVDPEGKLVDNNINITGNRSDALAWELGPRWVRFWGNSQIDTYFYVGQIYFDDETIQESTSQDARLRFGSDPETMQRISYELDYRYRVVDYDETGKAKFQRAQLEMGYFASPFFQLIGIAGLESNLATNDGQLDEPYWEAGFRSWFGQNLLEAVYGRRYYGPMYRLEWERRTEKSLFKLNYRELQQTDEIGAYDNLAEDVENDIDPVSGSTLAPDTGLERPGTGVRTLSKRWRAVFRVDFYRSDIRVFAFLVDREQITPVGLPGVPANQISTDESYGAGLDLGWDTGAHTRISLFGDWVNRKFDTDQPGSTRDSDLFRGNLRLRYDIGAMTEVIARAGYQTQTGNTDEFDEWHAGIEFRRFFVTRR